MVRQLILRRAKVETSLHLVILLRSLGLLVPTFIHRPRSDPRRLSYARLLPVWYCENGVTEPHTLNGVCQGRCVGSTVALMSWSEENSGVRGYQESVILLACTRNGRINSPGPNIPEPDSPAPGDWMIHYVKIRWFAPPRAAR